ncbi:MAG: glycosyltransferase family 39 protein [Streptosporangiaceae bacterium]|jgi:4-amino-4-deoxy-L-arabinose transferase-like glycosyltransferase
MILSDLMDLSSTKDRPAHTRSRRRWELWRSPDGQPSWARPVLLGIAAVAALLYAWNIVDAGLAPFYSVAVKSMSVSWKAFIFGAFDPNATITIDKLAGSFLPQALSARIFGFHPWSLALPQVIEGVISVLAMYRIVRRWAGVMPGLVAAALFTLTPIAASMFGHSMEDGALTMCLVLAADSYQRAVGEARLRSLIWAGVWIGLGFQAKMLQAWMVLPALAIGYLVCAPAGLGRRVWQTSVAGVIMLAVSLSWIALYTFTPASDRPYVDGSTNNSAIAMVFGYNGLERFGITIKGAVTSGPGVTTGGGGGGGFRTGTGGSGFPSGGGPGGTTGHGGGFGGTPPGGTATTAKTSSTPGGTAGTAPGGNTTGGAGLGSAGSSFGSGWTKLLGSEYGPEVGWLYPLAVLTVIFGLAWTRRAKRSDQLRAGFVFWGLWLLTFGLIFSKMGTIPHTAYVASLAPPLAALGGTGIVMFWRTYRANGWRGWVLPAVVAAQLAWTLFLWRSYGGFLPWARDIIVAAGVIAIVAMIGARLSNRVRTRIATVALAGGIAAIVAAPGAWAASVLDTKYGGSSFNASAGPAGGFGGGGGTTGGTFASFTERYGDRTGTGRYGDGLGSGQTGIGGGAGGGITNSATTTLTTAEQDIYHYVEANRDGASYLMAVASWETASPYILATGQEVMPMGGFSGSVPEPTLAKVEELVHTGQLRFFLLDSSTGTGTGFGGGTDSTSTTISTWVEKSCSTVPAKDYDGSTDTLYVCSRSA